MMSAGQLKNNLAVTKNFLGNQCNFLSIKSDKRFNEETNSYEKYNSFYAIMKNDFGSVDKVTIPLDKETHLLTLRDFQDLVSILKSKSYDTRAAI